jgi:hypothetical protein
MRRWQAQFLCWLSALKTTMFDGPDYRCPNATIKADCQQFIVTTACGVACQVEVPTLIDAISMHASHPAPTSCRCSVNGRPGCPSFGGCCCKLSAPNQARERTSSRNHCVYCSGCCSACCRSSASCTHCTSATSSSSMAMAPLYPSSLHEWMVGGWRHGKGCLYGQLARQGRGQGMQPAKYAAALHTHYPQAAQQCFTVTHTAPHL